MDSKADDEEVTLELEGGIFVVPKEVLIEKCEYFKAKFGGSYKDSEETLLKYPDMPAESFRLVHECLFGKTIATEDVQFPGIEMSLSISDFFCVDIFRSELKQTLLSSWEKTVHPLRSLLFAEEVFWESKDALEKRCIEVAHAVMRNDLQFEPCLAYQLILHAIQKEDFINSGIYHDSYRFTDCCVNTIKMVFLWIVSNSFAPSKLLHLVKYLHLKMFPPAFPNEVLMSIKTKDRNEAKSKRQLEDILTVQLSEIENTIAEHFDCAYILSSSYNYSKFCTADVADFNIFSPKDLTWRTDKIQIAAGSRVIHAHIIDKIAYLITSKSLDIIDLCTVKLKKSIKDETFTRFLNEVWAYEIQIITCHGDGVIYIVPEEPENDCHNSICPLIKFDIATERFSSLPRHRHPDLIRAVFCFRGNVYFAGLSETLIVYRYDTLTNMYSTLCEVEQTELFSSSNCQSLSVCFGVWQEILYVFCFTSLKTTFFTLDPNETATTCPDIVSLMNHHFSKCWRFTKPYLCHVRVGFLVALQIHDCMPDPYSWNDIILTLFIPQSKDFELLGFLPRLHEDTGGRFGFGIRPHPY